MAKKNRAREAPFIVPPIVTVRGRRWIVLREHHLGDSDYDTAVKRDLKKARGECDMSRREIHLARGQSPRGEASTFLHELLHACSRGRISVAQEEKFVHDVERALLDALEQLEWVPRGRSARFAKLRA